MTKKTTTKTEPSPAVEPTLDPAAQRRAELGAIIGDPFSTYHDRKRARRELAELGVESIPTDDAPTSPGASPEPIPEP